VWCSSAASSTTAATGVVLGPGEPPGEHAAQPVAVGVLRQLAETDPDVEPGLEGAVDRRTGDQPLRDPLEREGAVGEQREQALARGMPEERDAMKALERAAGSPEEPEAPAAEEPEDGPDGHGGTAVSVPGPRDASYDVDHTGGVRPSRKGSSWRPTPAPVRPSARGRRPCARI
jgi:hypothetical protein